MATPRSESAEDILNYLKIVLFMLLLTTGMAHVGTATKATLTNGMLASYIMLAMPKAIRS